jgi:two-component system response regulator FixJ
MKLPYTISIKSQIYLVDHDQHALEALTALLNPLGASIKCFTSAENFLKEFTYSSNSCLLVEAEMPDFTGIQLMEYLLQKGQDIPTIVMANISDLPTAVRAMQANAVDFIVKPYIEQVLLRKVENILQRN